MNVNISAAYRTQLAAEQHNVNVLTSITTMRNQMLREELSGFIAEAIAYIEIMAAEDNSDESAKSVALITSLAAKIAGGKIEDREHAWSAVETARVVLSIPAHEFGLELREACVDTLEMAFFIGNIKE